MMLLFGFAQVNVFVELHDSAYLKPIIDMDCYFLIGYVALMWCILTSCGVI